MEISITFAGNQKESIKLKRYGDNLKNNMRKGLKECGKHGEQKLKESLRDTNSTKFFTKSYRWNLASRTGALRRSISHQMQTNGVVIGPHAPYAAIHEFGGTINVTPRMRAFLHYKGVHLKKSTTQIIIPMKKWFEPVVDKERPQFISLMEKSIYRDM